MTDTRGKRSITVRTRDERDSQSSDLEFGALVFALLAFGAPIILGAFLLTVYFAFFE